MSAFNRVGLFLNKMLRMCKVYPKDPYHPFPFIYEWRIELWNINLRCVTFVYAVEHLFNDAKIHCILLCCICLTL